MKNKHCFLLISLMLILIFVSACSSSTSSSLENTNNSSNANSSTNTGSSAETEDEKPTIDYPKSAIEIYVPANPGGQTDASARVVAEYMKKYLGGDIVIVNQAGGGGSIAFESVRSADPDGYRFLYYHQALHTGHATKQLEHDITALRTMGTYSGVNQVFVVSADAPWDTLTDFVEDAKNRPGELRYGGQLGGTTHFMGAMLAQEADIDIRILDVGTESDRMAGLLGGQIDIVVTGVGNALNYVESGDFKVLATISEERDPLAPEFPTAKEQGYDIVFSIVHTLYGPKELPDEIVEAWNKATDKLIGDEEYLQALENLGQIHFYKNAEDAENYSFQELEKILKLGVELGF